jgi:hypothetical protein
MRNPKFFSGQDLFWLSTEELSCLLEFEHLEVCEMSAVATKSGQLIYRNFHCFFNQLDVSGIFISPFAMKIPQHVGFGKFSDCLC